MNMNDRSVRALLFAMFASSIPATLILPMMPSLGEKFGVGAAELGLLVGIYPLMSMLASPFWGRMSDRFGRKPILVITLLGGAAAFVCFALSTSWVGLLAGRAIQGLAGTPRGIGFAVASDMAGDGERSSGMGAVTASMAIGFTIGPLMGGLLMGENPDSWLGAARSWFDLPAGGFSHVIPSFFGALVNVISAFVIMLGFRESWTSTHRAEAKEDRATSTTSFAVAITHASVIIAILFFLLSGFIQGSLQFAFSLWADMARNWTAQDIAWAGAMIGLGFAIGSGAVLRPLIKRVGQEKTVLAGTLIDATGLCIFLIFNHIPAIALIGLLVSALGGALWATTILGLLSRDIDPRDQGLALGVANGAALFGRVLGPAFAGWLAANMSPASPFAFILFCVVVAIVRGGTLVRQHQRVNQ